MFQPPAKLELTKAQRHRVADSSAGVLLNVETMFIEAWRQDADLDDLDVEQALLAEILRRESPDNGRVRMLAESLSQLRAGWLDLDVF